VDSQGRVLGAAVADASGKASLAVAGFSPGSSLSLVANGIKTPLSFSGMTLGSDVMILNRNIFRPSQGPLVVTARMAYADHVTLKVYNLAGELMGLLAEGDVAPGTLYEARWSGDNRDGMPVASGVYFLSLHGGATRSLKKVVLIR
jgi:hypothetical protein